ncbi:DUF2177 family protein [Undibacterium sp.]|uniref:DUF2177 family protein n=1 Tax=Undibacterium sp. TaxID=1914977 RepID=UPI00272FA849|nr:DUF2177 family protein [Undibacterium sp.]MDP1980693.1 DUF2177 family protein [Undibacterium sp.]
MHMLSTVTSPTGKQLLIAYGAALVAILALDAIWLGLLMGSTYQAYLGDLMLPQPRLIPAALFYLLYSSGLLVLGILPALRAQSWRQAACLCGLLGLVAYGTYDLSNLATLKAWSPVLAAIDICWGAALSSCAGTLGYFAGSRSA